MARSVPEAFDEFFKRLTPLESQRVAKAKHRAGIESSLKQILVVNNIWETGSFTHGTGVRNHCDADVLVSIGNAQPGTADTALSWVKTALQRTYPSTNIRISKPAVVVEFSGGDETWEVIPGFYKSSSSSESLYDIPGPAGGWIESSPQAHLAYVNDVNKEAKIPGAAKKLARLIKAWKYYKNVPVSSFYLEMRAAQEMKGEGSFVPLVDLHNLIKHLEDHELADMNDPKGVTGRFRACSSDYKRSDALSKLATASKTVSNAYEAERAGRIDDAFIYLNSLFGGNFPAR